MRLKKVKGAKEKIDLSKYHINLEEVEQNTKFFNNDNPVQIEIGIGKGRYIYSLAKLNPNINYIGVEMFDSVIVRAIEKVEEQPLNNLLFMRCDAFKLGEKFSNYFDHIHLNFSDPWPKNRHEKRRLTSRPFLEVYKNILKKDGLLTFKTDNTGLFEYSVVTLNNFGVKIERFSIDLHHSIYDSENIRTEFEERFSGYGELIKLIEISFL